MGLSPGIEMDRYLDLWPCGPEDRLHLERLLGWKPPAMPARPATPPPAARPPPAAAPARRPAAQKPAPATGEQPLPQIVLAPATLGAVAAVLRSSAGAGGQLEPVWLCLLSVVRCAFLDSCKQQKLKGYSF